MTHQIKKTIKNTLIDQDDRSIKYADSEVKNTITLKSKLLIQTSQI